MSRFDGSMQHHVPFTNGNGHLTLARCESCMWGSHFDPPKWHSWAEGDDLRDDDPEYNARVLKQKCACDCADVPAVHS